MRPYLVILFDITQMQTIKQQGEKAASRTGLICAKSYHMERFKSKLIAKQQNKEDINTIILSPCGNKSQIWTMVI